MKVSLLKRIFFSLAFLCSLHYQILFPLHLFHSLIHVGCFIKSPVFPSLRLRYSDNLLEALSSRSDLTHGDPWNLYNCEVPFHGELSKISIWRCSLMDDSVFPERNLPVTCLGQATGAHLSLAAGVQKRAGVSRRGSPSLLPHIQDENYPRTLLSLGVPHPEEGGGLQSLLIAQHGGGSPWHPNSLYSEFQPISLFMVTYCGIYYH